ncbi:AAA family ATPase [Caballeronia sp. ATUFL_M2_KS44]|uniref:McrB family protein n=1 Tax=Caballeronia sp. ATUFL_M2_KS44 TaxID=2921767 RepID=UPI00202773CA|nr:AAA family ATPase [Caballeronia sp. ATUFL_M2_KS44]
MTVSVNAVIAALLKHKNVLIYGPPGTGKSHLMNEVAREFANFVEGSNGSKSVYLDTDAERVPLVERAQRNFVTRWVTFHQGYSYEDFVLGMRPEASGDKLFSLAPRAGVLLQLAAEAQKGTALLLIDEINRGNTSRIFGEFITLMEPGKRLDENGARASTTITVELPYLAPDESLVVNVSSGDAVTIGQSFAMPARLYTLASMNSVDKSIAPIDTALRRRFHIIGLFPSTADLREAAGLSRTDDGALDPIGATLDKPGVARLAVAVLEKLNRGIGLHLGQDFMLGQWYLEAVRRADASDAPSELVQTWLFRIVPQLMELFHGRIEVLISLLNLAQAKGKSGLLMFEPDSDELEAGAIAYLASQEPPPEEGEIVEFLQWLGDAPKSTSDHTAPA